MQEPTTYSRAFAGTHRGSKNGQQIWQMSGQLHFLFACAVLDKLYLAGGCQCPPGKPTWEDHPNTFYNGGEMDVKDGLTLEQCREGCCESDDCFAFGHCMEGAATCLYPVSAQHCIWYGGDRSKKPGQLRRNNFFTSFFHGTHCKPAPGSPNLPHFKDTSIGVGWFLVCTLLLFVAVYLLAGAANKTFIGGGEWLLHHQFWAGLGGLVFDGVSYFAYRTRHPGGEPQSDAGSAGRRDAVVHTADNTADHLAAPLLAAEPGVAIRGRTSTLHATAAVGYSHGQQSHFHAP